MKSLITTDAVKRLGMLSLLLGALSLSALAQQDIRITQTGFVRVLASTKNWAGSGLSAIGNNYIYTPTAGAIGACIQVLNNDTNSHGLTIAAYGIGSTQPTAYTNNTGQWFGPLQIVPATMTIPASSSSSAYFRVAGAAQVVVAVSGNTGAGTASLFLVESVYTDAPCNGGTLATIGNATTPSLVQCGSYANATIAAAGTTALIPAISGLRVYICGISVTTKAALTGNGFTFVRGTGATCGTGTVGIWGPIELDAAVGGSPYTWGGAIGIALPVTAASDAVCVTSAATAGTVDVSVWFTQML